MTPDAPVPRLRRRQDFVTVLREGRRVRHRILSLGLRPNGLPHNRYGYAIGKRVGAAVVRNRVRRRLREIMRALPLAAGFDIVLTAGEASATATFEQLRQAVAYCAERGDLLPRPVVASMANAPVPGKSV